MKTQLYAFQIDDYLDFSITDMSDMIQTIGLRDEIYLLGYREFVKLGLQENEEAIKLKVVSENYRPQCLYLK